MARKGMGHWPPGDEVSWRGATRGELAEDCRRVRVELVFVKLIQADRVANVVKLVIDQCVFILCGGNCQVAHGTN